MARSAKEVEFEVLGKEKPENHDPFIAFVTRLMDEIFVIPGTKIRFGLDPLVSLLPGFGASASAVVSLVLIVLSARRRVPRIVLAHMGVNVLINAALDALPVVGDALSIFYRSNSKNYELLLKHAGTAKHSTRGDWIFLITLLSIVSLILLMMLIGVISVATWLYHHLNMIGGH
jgi:Domain of unknown function (DUF4112)